jgi:topoisomerase IA-like protein
VTIANNPAERGSFSGKAVMVMFDMTLEKAEKAAAEIEELARSLQEASARENAKESGAQTADSGLLLISPRQYREYADEWKVLARAASGDQQREICLKMANIWLHAAIRFESGFEASDLNSERGPTEDERDQEKGG